MLPDLSSPHGLLSSPLGHGLRCPPSFIQQTPAVKVHVEVGNCLQYDRLILV